MSTENRIAEVEVWPPFELGPSDYIHALGAIAAKFNQLESWLKFLFRIYVDLPGNAALHVFRKYDNTARRELMLHCAGASTHDADVKDAVQHFCAGFHACAENRNILMHAQFVPLSNSAGDVLMAVWKTQRQRPWAENLYNIPLARVRQIAEEVNEFVTYGCGVSLWVAQMHRPDLHPASRLRLGSLPLKPAIPGILVPLPRSTYDVSGSGV